CSDSPTAVQSPSAFVPKSSFAVNTVTSTPAPTAVRGVAIVCKTGDVGGDFTFGRRLVGGSVGTIATSPSTIDTSTCLEVVNDAGGSNIGTWLTVTETPAANTVQTVAACSFIG